MTDHPSEYPWSSYRFNALGGEDEIVVPHDEYLSLGQTVEERQAAYRALFKSHISEKTLEEIRQATNKAWVLGSSYFKEKIAKKLNRPAIPTSKGGDRKSAAYRKRTHINRD